MEHSFSISLVSQGKNKFYTLTMPSEILAKTCFVSTRDEFPIDGFQRLLDKNRAKGIADYIDNGLGTIPTAIILSAQPEAELKITGRGKTLTFKENPKAFLILDGQHRVYGFSLAKTSVRVPVVIYNGLSRKDESRIFIDINTRQKPVSNELLFDIKNLAEYETNNEQLLRGIFDLFHSSPNSCLLGFTSPSSKSKDKISRVTFNGAFGIIVKNFGNKEADELYEIANSYLSAFLTGLKKMKLDNTFTNAIVFKAIVAFLPFIAQRTKDRYNNYRQDSFSEVLSPLFSTIKQTRLTKPGNSYKDLEKYFIDSMKTEFIL